jgi:hypothetical protein
MNPRIRPLSSSCPSVPHRLPAAAPELVTCEEADACDTTGPAATSGDWTPTTSDGVQTVTGDSPDPDASSGSTAPAEETGDEPGGTTDEPVLPPQIVDGVVIPDYIDDNGLLSVEVTAVLTEGVTMLLDDGELIELTPGRPGQFHRDIPAFTGFDNGKHTAILTPWRNMLVGESVNADYVIALPKPGSQTRWKPDGPQGEVAAIAVLPDGRPVELGTFPEMGAPRCYLRLRDKQGKQEKAMDFVPLLGSAYCRAIDLKIDRDTGRLNVLVERKNNGDDTVWWAGEISAWGKGLKNIGIGAVGDTALALAARPDVVAVCGSRAVASTIDKLDALAVLLRPGEPAGAAGVRLPAPQAAHSVRGDRATALSRATRSCSSARPTAGTRTTTSRPRPPHGDRVRPRRRRRSGVDRGRPRPGRPDPGARARPRRSGPLPPRRLHLL